MVQDLVRLDLNVRLLALGATQRLMDHDARVGQAVALAWGRGGEADGGGPGGGKEGGREETNVRTGGDSDRDREQRRERERYKDQPSRRG